MIVFRGSLKVNMIDSGRVSNLSVNIDERHEVVPEDVSVNQLPSEFLLSVFAGVNLVVASDVLVQGA
jgi:hypothetical protein